jgi:transglutaminase-like putative cysteine protease
VSGPERHRMVWSSVTGLGAAVLGELLGVWTALLPLLKVISPGAWLAGVFLVPVLLLAVGFWARWRRLPTAAVVGVQLATWYVVVMLVFLRNTAVLGLVPTAATVDRVGVLVGGAMDQVRLGTAPLTPTVALSALLVSAVGLLTVAIDLLVVRARLPLVAGVGLVAVAMIPTVAVPSAFDPIGFALLAATILFLLRTEARTRHGDDARARAGGSGAGGSGAALGIGAVAVIVVLIVAPILPAPAQGTGLGASTVSIDASLTLGADLRRPADIPVLSVRTNAPTAPYLRVATLSNFNGEVWLPDDPTAGDSTAGNSTAGAAADGFGAVTLGKGIAVGHYTTWVDVEQLAAIYLPVPFPAVRIDGVGSPWEILRANRTVQAADGHATTSPGMTYAVQSTVPLPTQTQAQAASARLGARNPYDASLPPGTPLDLRTLATTVTRGTTTDYDALIALQNWFRGPQFTYSLTAPVADGFDSSGIAAVEAFLKVRKGYCIHFASAFAIMARELGMASRIVVGYLPGTATGHMQDGDEVYAVTSSQLHAWVEVYFAGLGWVPFDPTASLGSPTDYAAANGGSTTGPTSSATPSAVPSASASSSANAHLGNKLGTDQAVGSAATTTASVGPWLFGMLAVVVALAMPGAWGALRRRRKDAAARDGDASAAWASVQDAAIDVGMRVPDAESPRAFGGRLVHERGVAPGPVGELVAAIERASYAQDDRKWFWADADLPIAASEVRAALRHSVGRGRRWVALLFPRSLLVRPGSVYAGSGFGGETDDAGGATSTGASHGASVDGRTR